MKTNQLEPEFDTLSKYPLRIFILNMKSNYGTQIFKGDKNDVCTSRLVCISIKTASIQIFRKWCCIPICRAKLALQNYESILLPTYRYKRSESVTF